MGGECADTLFFAQKKYSSEPPDGSGQVSCYPYDWFYSSATATATICSASKSLQMCA